jgi:hypothetical protein
MLPPQHTAVMCHRLSEWQYEKPWGLSEEPRRGRLTFNDPQNAHFFPRKKVGRVPEYPVLPSNHKVSSLPHGYETS